VHAAPPSTPHAEPRAGPVAGQARRDEKRIGRKAVCPRPAMTRHLVDQAHRRGIRADGGIDRPRSLRGQRDAGSLKQRFERSGRFHTKRADARRLPSPHGRDRTVPPRRLLRHLDHRANLFEARSRGTVATSSSRLAEQLAGEGWTIAILSRRR